MFFLTAPLFTSAQAPLGLTSSDKRRQEYKIKTPREAWTHIRLHQFLSDNPKAVYLLDNYEKHRSKAELEQAYDKTERADFYQLILPTVKASLKVHAGFKRSIEFGRFSIGGEARVSAGKTWNSEQLVKNYFSKDYVQKQDGSLVNKISVYSENLTHDIYECENNMTSCRINTDPAFRYLYERIFKKQFPDFPEVEKTVQGGQKTFISFEEIKAIDPKGAGFVDNLFTNQKTLKTTEEIKASVFEWQRLENASVGEIVKQFQNDQIERALRISSGKDQRLITLKGELVFLENSQQALQTQYETGELSKEEFNEQTRKINTGITAKKLEIEKRKTTVQVNAFIAHLDNSKKWVNAVTALAGLVGAPKEVIQTGRAISAGIDIFKGFGPMLIAGAFDPTGMTLAISGIYALFSVFSDPGPNVDQIILDELSLIKSNQIKMINLLYKIEFEIAGIKAELKRLENLLNKNHQELKNSLKDIRSELLNIVDGMNTAYAQFAEVANELLTQNTENAGIANAAAVNFNQKTLDQLYKVCHNFYLLNIQGISNRNKKLIQTNACLDLCISEQTKQDSITGLLDSCENLCPPPEDAGCDSTCMQRLIEQKLYARQLYRNCQYNADIKLNKLELELEGTYNDTEKSDKGTFVAKINQTWLSPEEINQILQNSLETRINTMPIIGNSMRQSVTNIVNSGKAEKFQESNLWNEAKLQQYQSFINEANRLKNPLYLDDGFSTYVDSLLRLPLPKTPIGIDGERYQYTMNHLSQMCQEVQDIENISTASRDNIQNAFILFNFAVSELRKNIQKEFDEYIKILMKDYDSLIERQAILIKKAEDKSATKCDCDKDYKGYLTGVSKYIKNISVSNFLNETPLETASSVFEDFNKTTLMRLGFKRISRFEDQCKSYRGQKKVTSAHVDTPTQLKMIRDTLLDVQNGEQGGCWFTDRYGLITNNPGEIIQLYQMTGIDEFGDPAPEPMCAVFVTGTEQVFWYLQPSHRAVCLHAELEFLYDGDFFTDPEKQIYYLTKEETETLAEPRPVSARQYMKNTFAFVRQGLSVEIQNKIKEVNTQSSSLSITYEELLDLLLTNYYDTSDWYTNSSMKIDIVHNRNYIQKQQGIYPNFRNTDSYGKCYEDQYACLKIKDVPIYTVDRKGWIAQAVKEIEQIQEDLEDNIKTNDRFNFNFEIKELISMWYNLDTLAKAGYGEGQIQSNPKLSDLKDILEKIRTHSSDLNNKELSDQLTELEDLFNTLQTVKYNLNDDNYSDTANPLLPFASVENYGFGLPSRRTSALEKLKQRSDIQHQQCLYRENNE